MNMMKKNAIPTLNVCNEKLRMSVNLENKYVSIWLTNDEKNDPEIQQSLKEVYNDYRGTKYRVVVFESGREDLVENTKTVIAHNYALETFTDDLTR